MYQTLALELTIALVASVMFMFLFVALRSGGAQDYAAMQSAVAKIRTRVFWGLVIVITPIIGYTLTDLPYTRPAHQAGVPQIVNATARQWAWDLSSDTVSAGVPVEFRVASVDVNHGFGIYDASLRLVAQTQAMPKYVNVVHHTFDEPGTYRILCLEYCGLAHHGMMAQITVTAN